MSHDDDNVPFWDAVLMVTSSYVSVIIVVLFTAWLLGQL